LSTASFTFRLRKLKKRQPHASESCEAPYARSAENWIECGPLAQAILSATKGAGRMNPRHGNDLPVSVGLVALAIALIVIIILSRLAGQ
jgi:hypothetical protein